MEQKTKYHQPDEIKNSLLFFFSAIIRLFSDVAYTLSIRGNRQTSDLLGNISTKVEKKSRGIK